MIPKPQSQLPRHIAVGPTSGRPTRDPATQQALTSCDKVTVADWAPRALQSPEFGKACVICRIERGGERRFALEHRRDSDPGVAIGAQGDVGIMSTKCPNAELSLCAGIRRG